MQKKSKESGNCQTMLSLPQLILGGKVLRTARHPSAFDAFFLAELENLHY